MIYHNVPCLFRKIHRRIKTINWIATNDFHIAKLVSYIISESCYFASKKVLHTSRILTVGQTCLFWSLLGCGMCRPSWTRYQTQGFDVWSRRKLSGVVDCGEYAVDWCRWRHQRRGSCDSWQTSSNIDQPTPLSGDINAIINSLQRSGAAQHLAKKPTFGLITENLQINRTPLALQAVIYITLKTARANGRRNIGLLIVIAMTVLIYST